MYCPSCGKRIPDISQNCPLCGANVSAYTRAQGAPPIAAQPAANNPSGPMKRKPLTFAGGMLLAGWVWLYTYKKDLWKFIFFVAGELGFAAAFVWGLFAAWGTKDWSSWMGFFGLVFAALAAFEVMIRIWIAVEVFGRQEQFYIDNGVFSKGKQ
jgi:hypothetical protein